MSDVAISYFEPYSYLHIKCKITQFKKKNQQKTHSAYHIRTIICYMYLQNDQYLGMFLHVRTWSRSVPRFYPLNFQWITVLSCSDQKFLPSNDLKRFEKNLLFTCICPFKRFEENTISLLYVEQNNVQNSYIQYQRYKEMEIKYSKSIKRLNQI